MSVQPRFQNRKVVTASNERELNKRINYHQSLGWKKVGKVSVSHGAYRSDYTQVMQYVGKSVVGG